MNSILEMMPLMYQGLLVVLWVFGVTAVFSIPLGIIVCLLKLSGNRILGSIIDAYILLMRGTPLMLQLVFLYFGLAQLKISLTSEFSVAAAFILNYTAYFAEIFRGGMISIDVGQYEAAKVLGISKKDMYFGIIFPQLFKRVVPPVGNEIITLVKDTSLVYAIGLSDIIKNARGLANQQASITPFFLAAAIYLILILFLTLILKKVEAKYDYYR